MSDTADRRSWRVEVADQSMRNLQVIIRDGDHGKRWAHRTSARLLSASAVCCDATCESYRPGARMPFGSRAFLTSLKASAYAPSAPMYSIEATFRRYGGYPRARSCSVSAL